MEQTREPERYEEQREVNDDTNKNLSDPTTLTFNNDDFSHEPAFPIESDFTLPSRRKIDTEEDTAVALTHHNQHKLAALCERFGHLSFFIIKLMTQGVLISRDLENVDSPTCPGCSYGKSHRKPWQQKGVRIHKSLNIATVPG